ncbi:hypothetical protein COOONC_10174 [Cooperia oncophora]
MTHDEPRARSMSRPRFDFWNLATTTSGLRIFQSTWLVYVLCSDRQLSASPFISPTYGSD